MKAAADDIPLVRLQALPYATYCIACQQELEKTWEDQAGLLGSWGRILDAGTTESETRSERPGTGRARKPAPAPHIATGPAMAKVGMVRLVDLAAAPS